MTHINSNRQSNLEGKKKKTKAEKGRETGERKMPRRGEKTLWRPVSKGSHGVPGEPHSLDTVSSNDEGGRHFPSS